MSEDNEYLRILRRIDKRAEEEVVNAEKRRINELHEAARAAEEAAKEAERVWLLDSLFPSLNQKIGDDLMAAWCLRLCLEKYERQKSKVFEWFEDYLTTKLSENGRKLIKMQVTLHNEFITEEYGLKLRALEAKNKENRKQEKWCAVAALIAGALGLYVANEIVQILPAFFDFILFLPFKWLMMLFIYAAIPIIMSLSGRAIFLQFNKGYDGNISNIDEKLKKDMLNLEDRYPWYISQRNLSKELYKDLARGTSFYELRIANWLKIKESSDLLIEVIEKELKQDRSNASDDKRLEVKFLTTEKVLDVDNKANAHAKSSPLYTAQHRIEISDSVGEESRSIELPIIPEQPILKAGHKKTSKRFTANTFVLAGIFVLVALIITLATVYILNPTLIYPENRLQENNLDAGQLRLEVDLAKKAAEDAIEAADIAKKELTELRKKIEKNNPEQKYDNTSSDYAKLHQSQSDMTSLNGNIYSCNKPEKCIGAILNSVNPLDESALNAAVVKLSSFERPTRGDRRLARDLNKTALSEFGAENFIAAVQFARSAAAADPGDVEIVSNLALIASRAGAISDADIAINNALILNPRRTSTWIAAIEYYAARGNIDSAIRAALVAYYFSADKEKTIIYYHDQADLAPKYQLRSVYKNALLKINY